jgi:hypothetical protein
LYLSYSPAAAAAAVLQQDWSLHQSSSSVPDVSSCAQHGYQDAAAATDSSMLSPKQVYEWQGQRHSHAEPCCVVHLAQWLVTLSVSYELMHHAQQPTNVLDFCCYLLLSSSRTALEQHWMRPCLLMLLVLLALDSNGVRPYSTSISKKPAEHYGWGGNVSTR